MSFSLDDTFFWKKEKEKQYCKTLCHTKFKFRIQTFVIPRRAQEKKQSCCIVGNVGSCEWNKKNEDEAISASAASAWTICQSDWNAPTVGQQNTKSHLCIFKILLQQNILQWTVMLEISMAKTAFGTHCCCYMIKIKSMLRWKQQAGGEGKQK